MDIIEIAFITTLIAVIVVLIAVIAIVIERKLKDIYGKNKYKGCGK